MKAGVLLVVAAIVLIFPAVLVDRGGTSEAYDEANYHLPLIAEMQAQWPAIDIVDYPSATAPGWHALLAGIGAVTGADVMALRLVNALAAIVLLVVLYRTARRWASDGQVALLLLPVLASTYFLSGAIWLTTDNVALLWVMLALAAVTGASTTGGRLLGAGLAAAVAVSIRQVHLWVAGPIALAGVLVAPLANLPAWLRPNETPRWWRATLALVAIAMPTALLLYFRHLWGGLTPPAYRDLHDVGINPATYGFALGLLGGFGMFFLPALGWRRLSQGATDRLMWIVGAAAFAIACVFETSYHYPETGAVRGGGALWSLVKIFPVVAERSVLLPPLAALGAMTLVLLVRGAIGRHHGRAALVLVVATVAFIAAQSFNSRCFQRYFEVLLLSVLAWLTAMAIDPPGPMLEKGRWWIGPIVLAGGQATISVLNLYLPLMGDTAP